MKNIKLFQMALMIKPPWFVKRVEFSPEKKRLDLYLDFKSGSSFSCPVCGKPGKAYDATMKTWRHLNFFQYETYLHARVPRMKCEEHGVKLVEVSWSRKQSGFTLLFEAMAMLMAKEMPVNAVGKLLGVTDKRLWRVMEHYVTEELEKQDLSMVKEVGVDETSIRRGHSYVSLFVDMETGKVIYVTEGKDSSTVQRFSEHLNEHGGKAEKIKEVSCDMSPAYIPSLTFPKVNSLL